MGEFVLYLTLGLTPLAFFVINTLVNNKREDKKELEKYNYEAGFKDAVNHIECLLYELADGSDSLCPAKMYIKVMGEVLELDRLDATCTSKIKEAIEEMNKWKRKPRQNHAY